MDVLEEERMRALWIGQVVPCAMNRVKRLKGSHVCTESFSSIALMGRGSW